MHYLTTADFEAPICQCYKGRTVLGPHQRISRRDGKTVFFYNRLLQISAITLCSILVPSGCQTNLN